MREIKFRAWQKYHKKMVEVTNISFDDNGEINGVATFVENQAPQRISYRDDLLGRFFLRDERGMVLELMQYTGLKDKKGVEIYEGDILTLKYPRDRRYTVTAKVIRGTQISAMALKFEDGFTTEEIPLYKISAEHNLEVIGNIYENPELLEREAE